MEFNIKKIFRNSFGYEAPEDYKIPKADERKEFSDLGQAYYKEDALGREFFLPLELDGYLIPFAVVSVAEKNTIVETPMPERGGAALELISIDNYSFNIKGILLAESFPEKEMRDVHGLFKKGKSLTLRSVITDIFLSGDFDHKVAIRNINWPATAGVEHAKPFEITCTSDMIFTLDIGDITGPVNIEN